MILSSSAFSLYRKTFWWILVWFTVRIAFPTWLWWSCVGFVGWGGAIRVSPCWIWFLRGICDGVLGLGGKVFVLGGEIARWREGMFYSQFILAKKGPLGTIWIAAHLERKLRKNQVADTDIGVSVGAFVLFCVSWFGIFDAFVLIYAFWFGILTLWKFCSVN